jgi:hypothetical protein
MNTVKDVLHQLADPPAMRTREASLYAERVARLAEEALEGLEEPGVRLPIHGQGGIVAYAVVDEDVAGELGRERWYRSRAGAVYRPRVTRTGHAIGTRYLAREALKLEPGDRTRVVYINHDRLDCRRSNLRVVELGAVKAVPKAEPEPPPRPVPSRCRFGGRRCDEPAGFGRFGGFCKQHAAQLARMRGAA